MKIHELKTIQPYFGDVVSGIKTFEIRKNDRDYNIGDYLRLREYDPILNKYTGDHIFVKITYMLSMYVIDGFVVLGIEILKENLDAELR